MEDLIPTKFLKDLMLYRHYDTPDGEDCFYKMFYTAKWSAVFGAVVGYFEVQAHRHLIASPGLTGYLLRGLTHSVAPFAAVGASFAAASCLSCSVRQKDDHWNYAFGGLVSGAVTGVVMKSAYRGGFMMIALALAAAMKKDGVMKNYTFFPDGKVVGQFFEHSVSLSAKDWDWSNIKDYKPRNKTYYFPANASPIGPGAQQ